METAAHISLSISPDDRCRAKELIAKSKEEMLSLLHDMPESDYELSLTDIVDKKSSGDDHDYDEEEEKKLKNLHKGMKAAERERERKRSNSGKSLRCSSDGVLLNFYTPTSLLLTRSLTTPNKTPTPTPTTTTSAKSINYTTNSNSNSNSCRGRGRGRGRENERIFKFMGCWSLPWDRRGNKSNSKRQTQFQFQFQFHNKEEENSKTTKK